MNGIKNSSENGKIILYYTQKEMTKTTIHDIINNWRETIDKINTEWVTLHDHRKLIDIRDQLIVAVWNLKKLNKDARLDQKNKETEEIKYLMEQWAKKTPAYEEVQNQNRSERYNLEKVDIDIETIADQVKNRAYYIRINEIDLMKLWVGETI
jgi:hypothetical protein